VGAFLLASGLRELISEVSMVAHSFQYLFFCHAPIGIGSVGVFFSPLHASHFSIYTLKMVGYVTILGLYQHNNSAALSDLEPA
jgi:hypothetical protein